MTRRSEDDDLDASSAPTHDELAPISAPVHLQDDTPPHGLLAVGSGRDVAPVSSPERAELDGDFFDREPSDPRSPARRDLTDRVTALERGAKRKRWAERIVSFLSGSALAVLVWALTKADANGAARETARGLATERAWLVDTVRALERHGAKLEGQLESILDRLRYPMQGPPIAPAPTQVPP